MDELLNEYNEQVKQAKKASDFHRAMEKKYSDKEELHSRAVAKVESSMKFIDIDLERKYHEIDNIESSIMDIELLERCVSSVQREKEVWSHIREALELYGFSKKY
jgi:hypothetical protein